MNTGATLGLSFEGERKVLTVSDLTLEARRLIESGLGAVWVEGEISNLARPSSGHLYWTLKDAHAQVRCAMFRPAARRLEVPIENGQQVLVKARASVYETRGEFQLVVDYLEEAGVGLLRRRFEELKRKLAAEGLFDNERKQALPALPGRIGVVTSPTGAAVRDVLIALRRRFPATSVLIYPTSVQGEGAPEEIVRALGLAEQRRDCDVAILTRGGGSIDDLWAFNEEIVARALAAMTIPVISGVGHETDFTIADFVADVRAPTPSQAAELAVPEQAEFLARLSRQLDQLRRSASRRLGDEARKLDTLAHRLSRAHPGVAIRFSHQRLDELESRRDRAIRSRIERFSHRLTLADRSLNSLSPLATLDRGYAIVSRQEDGSVVTDSSGVSRGTGIDVALARGRLAATVDRSDPLND